MERVVCLLANELTSYALETLHDDKSAVDHVLSFARSITNQPLHVFVDQHVPPAFLELAARESLVVHQIGDNQWESILRACIPLCAKAEQLVLCYADAPFLNRKLLERLDALHVPYKAHFSFADAFPSGYGVEIVDPEVLGPMAMLAARHPLVTPARDGLFELLKKDVNAFDIETEIAAMDMRMLRINLFCNSKEGYLLCRNVAKLLPGDWANRNPDELNGIIDTNAQVLRTIPSFFCIQLTERCPQACTYCPWGRSPDFHNRTASMDIGLLEKLVDRIAAFNPQAVIDVSLWGDPALYPHMEELARKVLSYPGLKLYIETAGIGWDLALLQRLAKMANGRITWIISLDSIKAETYAALRGAGFEDAWAFANMLPELFPGSCHMQAVRMTENEGDIKAFFDYWKEKGVPSIIQKFNHFSHRIKDSRVSDIAPFTRFPCWHIKRDMNILVDGMVVQCRDDFEGEHVWGSVWSESLENIWQKGMERYQEHQSGRYPSICEQCDEYFTFNA